MNDNSMRAHVRRSATRGGEVRLTSAQLDALTDELACNGGILYPPTGFRDGCVGVVDGRRIILDDDTAAAPKPETDATPDEMELARKQVAKRLQAAKRAQDDVARALDVAKAALGAARDAQRTLRIKEWLAGPSVVPLVLPITQADEDEVLLRLISLVRTPEQE